MKQRERDQQQLTTTSKVTIVKGKTFLYLDMELIWSDKNNLHFQVHLKENQQLKYLNKGSSHTNPCFKAIPKGVCQRLAKLTTVTKENGDKPLNEIYPNHFKALEHAGLIEEKVPTLREELAKKPAETNYRKKSQNNRNRKRACYFCVGYSKAWTRPIHQTIKEVKDRYKLGWLRVSMSYHRFNNLRELLQGDMSGKINKGIVSLDFQTLECNCLKRKTRGCDYNGVCRSPLVVYKVVCKNTGKIYIGNTQRFFKKRMQDHFGDTKRLHLKGEKSDTYAKHFAKQFPPTETPTPDQQRAGIYCSIIWKGNPISAVKTFATRNCTLCARERLEILKQSRKDPHSLINSCNEIYGACRHNPKFHRYDKHNNPSTDESIEDEKVQNRKVTTEVADV